MDVSGNVPLSKSLKSSLNCCLVVKNIAECKTLPKHRRKSRKIQKSAEIERGGGGAEKERKCERKSAGLFARKNKREGEHHMRTEGQSDWEKERKK